MKRKKNKDRQQHSHSSACSKISQRLLEFAGDFIRIGDTLEERQNHLNAACSAWNIACNTPELRKTHLEHYLREYGKFNPAADEEQRTAVRTDMETLIATKLKMFPHNLRQAVQARIIQVGGQDRIEAAALTLR